MEEQEAWLSLNLIPQVGPILFERLLNKFGSAIKALEAPYKELCEVPGIGHAMAREITSFPWRKALSRELEELRRRGLNYLTLKDEGYPPYLRQISQPPPVLYLKGELKASDQMAVAIVGSRRATNYGIQVAERLAGELAIRGVTIVSGMARGIDAAAHRGALSSGGRTLAVWGSGLDIVYPPEHKKLAGQISESGSLLTEFPLGTPPHKGNFPRRNRIISGLSLGVVVVEATADSGALITADYALEQGREVFAVPGPITARTATGTHRLLKGGAKLVEGWEDILEELAPHLISIAGTRGVDRPQIIPSLNEEEQRVYRFLGDEPLHIDEIIRIAKIPVPRAASLLMALEMKGAIQQLEGKMFVKKTLSPSSLPSPGYPLGGEEGEVEGKR